MTQLSVVDLLNNYFVNITNDIKDPNQITSGDRVNGYITKHNDPECIRRTRYDMTQTGDGK